MTMERLSMVAPDLARGVQHTTNVRVLRRAAHTAAASVVSRAAVTDGRVVDALARLAAGTDAEALRAELVAVVEELDDRAWTLQDAHDAGEATEHEYLGAFAQARAVAAVVAALHADPTFAALEAAYEAHCAFADGSGVLEAVARTLEEAR